jgi:dolichol-phosphate mannosyltransferase
MVSIIIPTYQEAENLPRLITAIENSLAGIEHELIVVDDNSPDGTGKLAEELAQKHRNLKVVHRQDKKGVASAIVDGIKIATGQIIGTLNADRQHPAELLPIMLKQIETHDVVIASRYLKKGRSNDSFWRRFVSRGAITMAHLLIPSSRGASDPMSGFFLFKRSVPEGATVLSRPASATISTGIKFLLELLATGHYTSFIEVPYTFRRRQSGQSKFELRDYTAYPLYLFDLMRISGELKRIIKFCLVGGSGIGIYMGLMFLLTDIAGLLYVISAVFSWLGAVTSNFIFNELWTFRDLRRRGKQNTLKRAIWFIGVRLAGLIINITILFCLTELLGVYYLVSALIAILVVVTWNYLASLNLVWNK